MVCFCRCTLFQCPLRFLPSLLRPCRAGLSYPYRGLSIKQLVDRSRGEVRDLSRVRIRVPARLRFSFLAVEAGCGVACGCGTVMVYFAPCEGAGGDDGIVLWRASWCKDGDGLFLGLRVWDVDGRGDVAGRTFSEQTAFYVVEERQRGRKTVYTRVVI